jgi:predicted TIM-barrel fold metal-dependent hydrolase
MICDAHCHFFSQRFFQTLKPGADAAGELGWDAPGTPEELADRWVAELDRHGVSRASLMASVPGDEDSVAVAVARHPSRFVGFFLLDPTVPDAVDHAAAALARPGMRAVCLFPAMHRYSLHEERVSRVLQAVASVPGAAVFVHCGVLSVGVRKLLGLPSRFDMAFGNPLDLHARALAFPHVPFIIPHFGAGMFREALMVADLCPNVYLDTSSSNGWIRYHSGLTLRNAFHQAIEVVGPERLLFGTDSSFFPRGWVRAVYETQAELVPEDAAEKIFHGNFERLFPINASTTAPTIPR